MLVQFLEAALDGVFMSKAADRYKVADSFRVWVPLPNRLDRWIDDLGFFLVVDRARLDFVLAYIAFSRGKEVDWS